MHRLQLVVVSITCHCDRIKKIYQLTLSHPCQVHYRHSESLPLVVRRGWKYQEVLVFWSMSVFGSFGWSQWFRCSALAGQTLDQASKWESAESVEHWYEG